MRPQQVFKFCCYISIPIGMTVAISGSPRNLATLIKNVRALHLLASSGWPPGHGCGRFFMLLSSADILLPAMQRDYVVYPPEGPRPPTADELHEMVQKEQQRRRAA